MILCVLVWASGFPAACVCDGGGGLFIAVVCMQRKGGCFTSYLVNSLVSSAVCCNADPVNYGHSDTKIFNTKARWHKDTWRYVITHSLQRFNFFFFFTFCLSPPLIYSPSHPPASLSLSLSWFFCLISISTPMHSEMLPCHSRQWEHWASLLFSSPPVHSAPHWQQWC